MPISRRDLAKSFTASLVVGGMTGATSTVSAEAETARNSSALNWEAVYPGIWKATFGSPEEITPVRSRLIPPAVEQLKALPLAKNPKLIIQARHASTGVVATLPLEAEEFVYGFGLQLLSLESRGKKRVLRVNADPKFDTGDSHAPVPFYVTSRGYGILIDSARPVEFFVGNARRKPMHPLEKGSGPVVDPLYTHNLVDANAGEIFVNVPNVKGVDVYLFAGPTMLDVVRRYNLFSGSGVKPPEWGLGFWYRGYGRANQQEVTVLARSFRERSIPCDVFGLEPGWHSHAYSCSFVWDERRFAQPVKLIADFNEAGFKVNLWEHAYTHPSSPMFNRLLPHSGDYGVWGGLVPDFQGKEARQIFAEYHRTAFVDKGIAGFKLDECDGSDYTGGWAFPDLSRFPSGCDGEQMHGLFGLRYQHAVLEAFKSRSAETYGMVRSSGALAAPYPFVLYSDLYDHRQFIRGIVTSSFCGLLWTPEVRDAKTSNDLIRRLQSVVFSPLAIVNGWYIKNPPWTQIDRKLNNNDVRAENWEELEARCREIIGWRMRLIPYLQAAFCKYAKDGTAPFRALQLDYEDASLKRVDDQFMVGDRMMVAPLFDGEAERTIHIPQGSWHDFWTGEAIAGGQVIRRSHTERNIPVFVKAGSLIPLATITQSTVDPKRKQITVRVYGDGSLTWSDEGGEGFQLAWNEGANEGVVKGRSSYEVVRWERSGKTNASG